MEQRHDQSVHKQNFIDANRFAEIHSQISKGQPLPLSYMIMQWFLDGYTNFWSLICNIPELYKQKYSLFPTTSQYREIIQKNIKKVILPLSSLNLHSLVGVIRPDRDVSDMKEFVNNSLWIDVRTFSFDDNDYLTINSDYMHEIVGKMNDEVHQYRQAQLLAEMIGGTLKNTAEYPMRTWCPALAIEMKDGKRMVEQFCHDVLCMLDKIYFPFWDK